MVTLPRLVAGVGLALTGWVLTLLGGKLVAWHELRGAGQHDDGLSDAGEAVASSPALVGERAASLQRARGALPASEDEANVTALREYLEARRWHPSLLGEDDAA